MVASIISTEDLTPGDPNRLLTEIKEARAQAAAQRATAKPEDKTNDGKGPNEPARFAGKSREDILNMYDNLERHTGRLANELGQTQRAVQELIVDKRARDLRQNGEDKPVKVDPTELLQRPTEALAPFIEDRVTSAITPLQQQLSRMEQLLGTSVFNNHHGDAATIMQTPEFTAWARETPLRRSIAQMAANGNMQAADELLTEFKNRVQATNTQKDEAEAKRLEQASTVTLEQSRTGGDGNTKPTGKIYRRADVIALMQTPAYETDESLQLDIQRAYEQGRVK